MRFQPVRSGDINGVSDLSSKAYGDHVVLHEVNLDVLRGEKVALSEGMEKIKQLW